MKIPYQPVTFKRLKIRKYIIVHDMTCMFDAFEEFKTNKSKYQFDKLSMMNFALYGQFDLNYHYVVERIRDDYQTFVARPLYAYCEYEDIPSPYNNAIHVAVMMDFEAFNPDDRLYKHLAYRTLGSVMNPFKMNEARLFFHGEVTASDDPLNIKCPGSFLNKDKLKHYLKPILGLKS